MCADASPRYARNLAAQKFIQQATDTLTDLMGREGTTRAELARRLERSPSFVSQILNGHRNLTLTTLSNIAWELGYELEIKVRARQS